MVANLNNTTDNDIQHEIIPYSIFIPVSLITVTECVAIVFLNIVAIGVFVKQRSINRQTTYLIINLAIADTLVGAVTGPLLFPWDRTLAYNVNTSWKKVKFYMDVVASGLFPTMSLQILAAISLERLHATFNPIKHRVVTKRAYHVVIAVLWVFTILVNVIMVFVQEKRMAMGSANVEKLHEKARQSFLLVSCLTCLISLMVVGSSYFAIFVKMKYGSPISGRRRSLRDKKLTVTLFVVTIVSFLTWLPLLVYFVVAATVSLKKPNFIVVNVFRIFAGSNSLVNPILYVFRVNHFRLVARHLFRQIFCQAKDANTTNNVSRTSTM